MNVEWWWHFETEISRSPKLSFLTLQSMQIKLIISPRKIWNNSEDNLLKGVRKFTNFKAKYKKWSTVPHFPYQDSLWVLANREFITTAFSTVYIIILLPKSVWKTITNLAAHQTFISLVNNSKFEYIKSAESTYRSTEL